MVNNCNRLVNVTFHDKYPYGFDYYRCQFEKHIPTTDTHIRIYVIWLWISFKV